MGHTRQSTKNAVVSELAQFFGLLLVGLILLPVAIYFVGNQVFGDYDGAGFTGFFNALGSNLRELNWVAWFLVLSPYFAWQSVRLTRYLWRAIGRSYENSTTVRH